MTCDEATEKLGLYLDDELPSAARHDLASHLATCSSCRAGLDALRDMTSKLAAAGDVSVPDCIWTAIERRLDDDPGSFPRASPMRGGLSGERSRWPRHLPLALAAAVVLAVGLGMVGLVWTGPRAEAATVDYSVLLDALPLDAQKAFRKFLVRYDAKPSTPVAAKRFAPKLTFETPADLPGGFRLQAIYELRFGGHAGIAAEYDRGGEFLGAVFHPPLGHVRFGSRADYTCVIGQSCGHTVQVGDWNLIHLTDPTTCHCVLSRLDQQRQLPEIMAAIAPALPERTFKRTSP